MAANPSTQQLSTPSTGSLPAPTWSDFAKWGGAFAVIAFAALSMSDTKYGNVTTAVVWLGAFGAAFYWFDNLDQGIAELIGYKDAKGQVRLS